MDSLRDEIEQEMKILNLDKRRLCNLLLKVLDASELGGSSAMEGARGAPGPPGPPGPRGPSGPQGPPGASVAPAAKSDDKPAAKPAAKKAANTPAKKKALSGV